MPSCWGSNFPDIFVFRALVSAHVRLRAQRFLRHSRWRANAGTGQTYG